jgi:hypothetical protein
MRSVVNAAEKNLFWHGLWLELQMSRVRTSWA